jgi:ubiquinone/menaquinone biosynthesis C-methylase UbiE
MHSICPWWIGYLLASPVRRIVHRPEEILEGYVLPGMTVLEPGPGMGFFTLELARRVGPAGRVVAVDIQPRMLAALERRMAKAGFGARVDARVAAADSMNLGDLAGKVDFTLAFAVVHEMPSAAAFFREAAAASKPAARLLFVEPSGHVSAAAFDAEIQAARVAGFGTVGTPVVRKSHATLLEKRD